jgi:hypothetical protein
MSIDGECTEWINFVNKQVAQKWYKDPEGFDPVCHVAVRGVISDAGKKKVVLLALGTDFVHHPYGPYDWFDLNEVWAACPTTLPSDAAVVVGERRLIVGDVPAVGASGKVYFSRSFLNQSVSQDNRVHIAFNDSSATPKWPSSLGSQKSQHALEVEATSATKVKLIELELKGIRLDAKNFLKPITLNLLDRSQVRSQRMKMGEGAIEIELEGETEPAIILPSSIMMQAIRYPSTEGAKKPKFDLVNYYRPVDYTNNKPKPRETPASHYIQLPIPQRDGTSHGLQVTEIQLTLPGRHEFGLGDEDEDSRSRIS